jgi:hypothetical protein
MLRSRRSQREDPFDLRVLIALGLDAPGLGQRGFVLVACAFQWAFAAQLSAVGAR